MAASAIAFHSMVASAAVNPFPRRDEWWFHAWSVQDKVWPLSKGAGVTVAVMDDGVNARLPELSNVVLPGLDTTGNPTKGQIDFHKQGHGTSMAALIAGQGGGTTGFVGLAPAAKILPIRLPVSSKDGSIEGTARGIRFAVDHGAKVINMSYGGESFQCAAEIESAIEYAIDHDVVLVASAGNDGNGANAPEQPARCPGVLAVGAVTKDSQPWRETQRQNYVTLAAPGAQMGLVGKDGTYYPDSRGTSGAAALASAAVALIRSHNPTMSGRTVVQRLIATAMRIGDKKWSPQTGYGVLLVRGAMDPDKYPVPSNAPNPVYGAFDKWKASTHRAPSEPPVTVKPKTAHSSGIGMATIFAGVGAAVLVVGGLITGFLVLSRRRGLGRTSHL
ncbi:S8 family serine peptidase [Actinomadura opuntiae]|uniref:S8 family serine peptidase n=1 Tax=Actinomadura sp. OS1-43 TaxID=604315 RepID=UPI00255AE37E|nr:S8 family serine peptidase [Actinomadura sp. OS1-43]MDL4820764.1 S8 family serine peptidase [Actinomadura sp. OS1-43]